MAAIPIFIIGAETLLLYALLSIIRLARKYSKFKRSMQLNHFKSTVLLFVFLSFSCGRQTNAQKASTHNNKTTSTKATPKPLIVGANRTETYLPLLQNKKVGIVANQTSVIFKSDNTHTHVVDSLLSRKISLQKVFALEHGFRGKADAGETVKDGVDTKTKLPTVSLYGKNKKPSKEQLGDIDIVVFDIQNVGARFYTYISSLHYIMEACAEQNVPVVVLDRPNPNRHIIDGPILEPRFKSFVGMHPIPVLHGMTIGEYAKMINGEGWLNNNIKCELTVIAVENYNSKDSYHLPIKPSPNLPNDRAINLYPSLCFFEGTTISAGRGTNTQFQVYGSPFLPKTEFSFTPQANEGAKYPKHQNKMCYGYDLKNNAPETNLNLSYLINAYKQTKDKSTFFNKNDFFNLLAGNNKLKEQVINNWSEDKIKATWKSGLDNYKVIRQQYTLYDN